MGAIADLYIEDNNKLAKRTAQLVSERWRLILILVAVIVQGTAVMNSLLRPISQIQNNFQMYKDSAIFEHGGWYISVGARPYVDIWDPKPPLTWLTSASMGYLGGGDMLFQHTLNILITSLAAIISVYLVGVLTYRLTQDELASVSAALVLLTVPRYYDLAAHGFRPKYFVILFGVSSLYLALEKRPLASGMAAAASAGFWQFGLIFPVIILLIQARKRAWRELKHAGIGIVIVTTVALLPIISWSATEAMITQVILAPIIAGESQPIYARLGMGLLQLGYTTILVLIGACGLVRFRKKIVDEYWWLIVISLWFGLQIFVFDYDNYDDLFLGLVFISIGLGLVVANGRPTTRKVIPCVVVVLVMISSVAMGGFGVLVNPKNVGNHQTQEPALLDKAILQTKSSIAAKSKSTSGSISNDDRNQGSSTHDLKSASINSPLPPDLSQMYWDKKKPTSCHYRMSEMERHYLQKTDQSPITQQCGKWPNGIL